MDRRRVRLKRGCGRRTGSFLRLWHLGREIDKLLDRAILAVSAVFFVVSLKSLPSMELLC